MSNLDLLDKAFRDHFPAKSENELASIEYVEVIARGEGGYAVVMRLVIWDTNPETGAYAIRDVKEQELYLGLASLDIASIGRMRALNAALVTVLRRALTHADVDRLMPHELVNFSPLKLAKAQTSEDFVKALSVRSRLGRYLPA